MKPFLTLHHPAMARAYYDAGLWRRDTFYDLLQRRAEMAPDTQALQDGRVTLSWSDLQRWVDAVATTFADRGLVSGDRVSIWLSNRAEAVVAFLACSHQGLACNPSLHETYTSEEVLTLLNRLNTKLLLTEPGWGADRSIVDRDALLAGASSLSAVLAPDELPREALHSTAAATSDPDRVSYLAFTSGTTGAPKCVMHSANTLLANARDLVADWELSPEARLLSLSPLSHHIGWVAVSQWLVSGCKLITDDPPAGLGRLDWLLTTKATYVMGVPTHAMDILAEMKQRGVSKLGDTKTFYMAGSPIPPVVAENFVSFGVKPQNIYGMTENSSHQYTHRDDDLETWTTSCGRGGGAYEVQIFDAQNPNRRLEVGETGQIGGRGAALMLGYFDNQTATEASFNDDGWFLSGDLGSLDERGNLRIEGRLKDLIIRGGHNIHPAQIEAIALRHPEIERAAAFPVPDNRLGERVCLAISGAPTADDVLRHLSSQGLSKYDMPEWFVRLDAFPLTASGKIMKRELIAMRERGDITPEACRFSATVKELS